jgi:hypothetical protein
MTEATDLANALFAALDAEDWTGAACLFNPVQVEEWYRAFLQRMPKEQDFSLTVDQYLKHSPDMPREVAEYQVAQMRRNHLSRSVSDELAGVATWEDAERLGAVEAYGRYLQHRDPREQFRRAKSGLPTAIIGEVESHQMAFDHVVLGGVVETDTLVHVVYRRFWADNDVSGSLHLLTCCRSEAGWTVEMSTEWDMALSNYSFVAEVFEEEDSVPYQERTDGV